MQRQCLSFWRYCLLLWRHFQLMWRCCLLLERNCLLFGRYCLLWWRHFQLMCDATIYCTTIGEILSLIWAILSPNFGDETRRIPPIETSCLWNGAAVKARPGEGKGGGGGGYNTTTITPDLSFETKTLGWRRAQRHTISWHEACLFWKENNPSTFPRDCCSIQK